MSDFFPLTTEVNTYESQCPIVVPERPGRRLCLLQAAVDVARLPQHGLDRYGACIAAGRLVELHVIERSACGSGKPARDPAGRFVERLDDAASG